MSFSPEDSLLSSLLMNNAAFWKVAEIVCLDDFTPKARRIYGAIADAVKAGEPSDPVTLWDKLGDDLGREALDIARNVACSVGHVEHYARMVAEKGEARRVQQAGERIALASSYAEAQSLLAAVRPMEAARVKSVEDGLEMMMEAMQLRANGPYGLSWGVPGVDAIAGRLVPARLYGVAGRAKMGKTTLALQPQVPAVVDGKRILQFSLEMTVAELMQRALCRIGQISHSIFEDEDGVPDEAWSYIHAAAAQIVKKGWLIDDQPGLTPEQIEARARQHHMQQPVDLIVVDHIGLVQLPNKGNRTDEIGRVTYMLKNLSKTLNVPVLALCQLNRNLETRTDKRPIMADLRDSGNIEQDMDCILSVYRDEVYNPGSADAGHAEITTLANRHGRGGTAFVVADMDHMTYGPAKHERKCFPGSGSTGAGSGGGGFSGYGAARSQPRAVSGFGSNN